MGIFDDIRNALDPKQNGASDFFDTTVSDALDPNKNGARDAYYKATDGAKKAADDVKNKITGAVDKVKDEVKKAADILTNPLLIVGGIVLLFIVMK